MEHPVEHIVEHRADQQVDLLADQLAESRDSRSQASLSPHMKTIKRTEDPMRCEEQILSTLVNEINELSELISI